MCRSHPLFAIGHMIWPPLAMQSKTRLFRNLVLLALLPLAQGCAIATVAVVAVGYTQYDSNKYESEYNLGFDRVWAAAQEAVVASDFKGDATTEVTGTEGDLKDGDLRVRVERLTGGRTRLEVRVGNFSTSDNRRRIQLVVESIHESLGIDPPVFEEEEDEEEEEAEAEPENPEEQGEA